MHIEFGFSNLEIYPKRGSLGKKFVKVEAKKSDGRNT